MDTNWQFVIIGLKRELNLSNLKLCKVVGCGQQTISRYERGERKPEYSIEVKILELIKIKNLDINHLEKIGKKYIDKVKEREKSHNLDIKYSEDFAELIGIILGDGEIHKDGNIRIAFNPYSDINFLNRRIIYLIENTVGNKPYYESYKRIAFGNKSLMKFLKNMCGLDPGSKFDAVWKIPNWCFENKKYLYAVLRGLFDTDGYFGYLSQSKEIMFGRFSDRCPDLVRSIDALKILDIHCSVHHTKDGRYRIRIHSKRDVTRFFQLVGSSNIKHIIRFLLWRSVKYEARIEIEGFSKLRDMVNNQLKINIESIQLPFLWTDNKEFDNFIKEDENYLDGYNLRENYNWSVLMTDLLKNIKIQELEKVFKTKQRSIRRWREGTRLPKYKYIPQILKLANQYDLDVKKYEVNDGTKR